MGTGERVSREGATTAGNAAMAAGSQRLGQERQRRVGEKRVSYEVLVSWPWGLEECEPLKRMPVSEGSIETAQEGALIFLHLIERRTSRKWSRPCTSGFRS